VVVFFFPFFLFLVDGDSWASSEGYSTSPCRLLGRNRPRTGNQCGGMVVPEGGKGGGGGGCMNVFEIRPEVIGCCL